MNMIGKLLIWPLLFSQLVVGPPVLADENDPTDPVNESEVDELVVLPPGTYRNAIDEWVIPAGLGAVALHTTACAGHCSPGPVPLITLTKEQPMAGCSLYLAAAGLGVVVHRILARRRTR